MSEVGKSLNAVSENCEGSLDEQIKYVGQSQVQMLVNSERFMPEEYGDNSISRSSSIHYVQFDETTPSWASLDVVLTEL